MKLLSPQKRTPVVSSVWTVAISWLNVEEVSATPTGAALVRDLREVARQLPYEVPRALTWIPNWKWLRHTSRHQTPQGR